MRPAHALFNGLPTLLDANARLRERLLQLGDKGDLAELKGIFERHELHAKFGLVLLHRHYLLNEGERAVEFGHVTTPWLVPDDGTVAGGWVVPRSWKFEADAFLPYEYGFNVHGQEMYEDPPIPESFVQEVGGFLTNSNLDGVLGLCALDETSEGRLEQTIGRVSITVPLLETEDLGAGALNTNNKSDHTEAVWSFNCHEGLESTVLRLARVCRVCPREWGCDG